MTDALIWDGMFEGRFASDPEFAQQARRRSFRREGGPCLWGPRPPLARQRCALLGHPSPVRPSAAHSSSSAG